MKSIFKILCLVVFFCAVSRASQQFPSLVYEVGTSSMTTVTITVSTSVATQMDNPTLAGRVSIEIQNIDSSANLWCNPNSGKAATNGSRKISPSSSWLVSLKDKLYPLPGATNAAAHIYCLSDGAASTKAAVSQAY